MLFVSPASSFLDQNEHYGLYINIKISLRVLVITKESKFSILILDKHAIREHNIEVCLAITSITDIVST